MWEQIQANKTKTFFLMVAMLLLMMFLGFTLGEMMAPGSGTLGIFLGLVIWFFHGLASYYLGDSFFLSSNGALPIERADYPTLYNLVEEMQIAAGLATLPKIYVIDDDVPNAFATGRDPEHASVAVTSGLMKLCSRDELQGVIAHELGHVKNRDILYMMMVGTMLGIITMMADIAMRSMFYGGRSRSSRRDDSSMAIIVIGVVLMIVAPLIAQVIYYTVSRQREYLADASGALFTRNPLGLANALAKISAHAGTMPRVDRVSAPMYIVNPLQVAAERFMHLMSTHPKTEERIRILEAMASGAQADFRAYDAAYQNVTGKNGVIPKGTLSESQSVETEQPKTTLSVAERDAIIRGDKDLVHPAIKAEREARHREVTDAVWHANGYYFIDCRCGNQIKVPPAFAGMTLRCPTCKRAVSTSGAVSG